MNVFVEWSSFKPLVLDKSRLLWWDRETFYLIQYQSFETTILFTDTTNKDEFDTLYKPYGNKSIKTPTNTDGRNIVHTTPRKIGTYTCFTGAGDGSTNQSEVGGNGTRMVLHHQVSDPMTQEIYIDLNTIANESYAHAGAMQWKDALLDMVTLETVPRLSLVEAASNTNYNLYGGYLVVPAVGDGTINVTDMKLVEVPLNEHGVRVGAGYWDATYNTSTHEFENIQSNPYGTGQFNMFTVEVPLDRFLNKVSMLGNGFMPLDTYDASMIGHNMRIKLTLVTDGTDHEWWWCAFLKPYRKRTV